MSKEAKMSADFMVKNITEAIDETLEKFIPRPAYEVHKSEARKSKYVEHKITGY